MNTREIINESLKYIELHLRDEITPEQVAGVMGYSSYHFYRLFSDVVGMSLKNYITSRRVLYVLYHAQDADNLLDLVFDYHFETYSGFYKACKKRYQLAPKSVLKHHQINQPSLYLYGKEHYPMLTKAKVKNTLTNWSFETIELESVHNENGQIRKDMYDFKNHRVMITNSLNKLEQNIAITEALKKQGIQTPGFIKTSSGKEYVSVNDQYVYIKERLNYTTYSPEEVTCNPEIAVFIGKAAGALHDTMTTLDQEKSDETTVYKTCHDWAIPVIKKMNVSPIDVKFFDEYETIFSELSTRLPLSIIHRNLHHDNIFYVQETLVGYGDFYNTQKDVRLFDVCYLSTSILAGLKVSDRESWPTTLNHILRGYESVVTLTKEEVKSIPYILYSIQMIFIAYFETQDGHHDLAVKNYDILKWLYKTLKD